jgi:FAD/FMN-containing dehydrogenase
MNNVEKKRIPHHKLAQEVYRALEKIVGEAWISQDRAIVESYSKLSLDATGFLQKHMKDPSSLPGCIVLPGSTEEVQAIIKVANSYRVPFVPFTNGQMLCAPTTQSPTICIHLSRMNKVLNIDQENMAATLQAYADYGQLLADAAKVGLWNGGTPLATTLCKLSSQAAFGGIWQTSKKYGVLDKNIINLKVVLPTGEILETGSPTVSGVGNFWEYGPGPDLFGLIRGSVGTTGIITEITVKLHPWVGGPDLPEPPAGRPSIPDYHEPKYDTAPPPQKHKLYWMEFPDYDTEVNAYREIAHSGIGIGLNATGVYNSYYCSQTQKMTENRVKEDFFPAWNLYLIVAGITSDEQITYEEKVVQEIAKEYGGEFLSKEYKPEVLEALAPWNLDCIRHVCGYRMNRINYAGGVVLGGAPEVAKQHTRVWKNALTAFGETYMTDRGGADNTVFLYAIDPAGRFNLTETDIYPDPMDVDALQKSSAIVLYSLAKNISLKSIPVGIGVSIEPLTSFFPEPGPNAFLLFRKFRKIFDPNGLCSPGRQVFTEEEFKNFPKDMVAGINKMKQFVNINPIIVRGLWVTIHCLNKIKQFVKK